MGRHNAARDGLADGFLVEIPTYLIGFAEDGLEEKEGITGSDEDGGRVVGTLVDLVVPDPPLLIGRADRGDNEGMKVCWD